MNWEEGIARRIREYHHLRFTQGKTDREALLALGFGLSTRRGGMRETLLTRKDEHVGEGTFDSIAWAFEVHLKKPDTGTYHSAVLYGTEDYPRWIDFYTQAKPLVTDIVAYRWVADDPNVH